MEKLAGDVTLYTTSWCGYCQAALALLDERGIKYENVDLTADSAKLRAVKTEFGHPTVPLILIGGRLLGGFSELRAMDAEHGLEHLKSA